MLVRFFFVLLFLPRLICAQEKSDNLGLYLELLGYHATQPSVLAAMKLKAYAPVSREVIERLNPEILKAHIVKYLLNYSALKTRLAKSHDDLTRMRRQIQDLPLTNLDHRPRLELAIAAQNKLIQEIPLNIFRISMNANADLEQSLKTLPVEQRVVAKKKTARPKLPGTFGGSAEDRMSLPVSEKIFLTPVDKEFTETQLGKKMQRDFGGTAEYWSYDYDKDELYVRVKGDTGRVRVIKDQGSNPIIQTRSGADFTNVFKDEVVDLFKAKGRFLTGSQNDDSLFGEMPVNTGPAVLSEGQLPVGHSHGDGHKH